MRMEFTKREKELLWRGLCDSERSEKHRIHHLTTTKTTFNTQAKQKMIKNSEKRLKEINDLKNKWLHVM